MIVKKNISFIFLIFLVVHLIIWTLVPTFSNLNLPLDTIEALAWGSNLNWGFDKHPPLSALIVEFFYSIFGTRDWAYYLLSQIFIIISFIYVWKLSNEFFKNRIFSLLSVLILEGIVFYNYTTPEFNVYVCQLPFRALTAYYFWKSINNKKIINLVMLGLFAAGGFLTHYSFIFLLLAMLTFLIFLSIKKKFFPLIYLLPLIVFVLVLLPHLIWLIDNNYTTISYALNRAGVESKNLTDHLFNPLIFIIKQVGVLMPVFVMSFLILSKNKKISINLKDNKILFLLSINILPILIIFFVSFLTGAKIKTMWMSTFYLFFGIFLLYSLSKNINLKKINKFIYVFIFLFFLSPATYLYVSFVNDSKRTDYPGKEIARLVQIKWDKNFVNDIKFVVGDEWAAGNLSYHLVTRPIWLNSLKNKTSKIKPNHGVIYAGNPEVLKKVCPGIFGIIKPVGYCMIGKK
jgi:4-amino-4-deoxy-L-arabinose transferase-like glycosyltransferase